MKTKITSLVLVLILAGVGCVSSRTDMAKAGPTTAEQIIELTAKDGYNPGVISAKAGVPVLLKVKTQDTVDCSTAFTVPSFGIKTILPATGVTEFNFPAQKAGESIEGSCQMGMDRFVINFN